MKRTDLSEAIAVGTSVIRGLLRVSDTSGQLNYAGGVLLSTLGNQITQATIAPALINLFEGARLVGATYAQMDGIRTAMEAMVLAGLPGIALRDFCIQLCLVEQTQILAATIFVSRQDIDAAIDAINRAFHEAIETAADAFDQVAYQLLVPLHAACIQDLSSREQTLPRMVTYTFPQPMPSLWLAQRIYADGSRADELAAENKARHPLFISSPISALSA